MKDSTRKIEVEHASDFSKVTVCAMHLPQFMFLYNRDDNSDTNEKHNTSNDTQIMK